MINGINVNFLAQSIFKYFEREMKRWKKII